MKLHRLISYGLMTTGAIAAARSIVERQRWEQANVYAAIMLDWDDVQAVATRALDGSPQPEDVIILLRRFRENGATHLSIPELTLNRLLEKGQLSVTQGSSTQQIYLQAKTAALADLVTSELQARLPHIDAQRTKGKNPVISFVGDLPSVVEVGLGFDPAHAEAAFQANLSPVARPIGYSWVQPEMIERTFDQAGDLGCKIVAVQGNLIPGHEFKIQHTVEAMRRNQLTYAYFRESRHQKGDWFLAKHLAESGLVMLAHEFDQVELLDEDLHTAAYRWATLAVEAGIRLCSVRFFRILHAADPLESMDYVHELAKALSNAGLAVTTNAPVNLTLLQPKQNKLSLACVGLSAAGAAGLASDLLPLPDSVKLVGVATGAAVLAGLPFADKLPTGSHHHDHHHHDNHHHDHDHHSHNHGPTPATAYAQKGLALAATVAYPAAAIAVDGADSLTALAHSALVGAAGVSTVAATTVDSDYMFGIEEYRGYNLDWLIPLGLAAASNLTKLQRQSSAYPSWLPSRLFASHRKSKTCAERSRSIVNRKSTWLPLVGVAAAGLASLSGKLSADLFASLDREHRHAHTHHLSQFQQQLGDLKMIFSPRPLRKWALLAPVGVFCAAIFKRNGKDELATAALMAGATGQVATLTGFRQGQRSLEKTAEGRAKSWAIGAALVGVLWLLVSVVKRSR